MSGLSAIVCQTQQARYLEHQIKRKVKRRKKGGEAKKQKPDGEGGEGRWGGRERESK